MPWRLQDPDMASAAEAVVLAVMVLFGLVTAGVLAYALRDMIAEVAGEDEGPVETAQRVAMAGPAIYLVGFLVVLAAVLFDPDPVAGVDPVAVGFALVVLAAVPMAAGFYLARRAG